jgi:hypothetical protein
MSKAVVLLTAAAVVAGAALNGSAIARDRTYSLEIRADRNLTANQLVDQVVARTARIKADLRLTQEQADKWGGFESATRDIAKTNADRQIALREERKDQKGPPDIIELMRRESKFLSERSADRKKLAEAAAPLYASLDEQQKRRFAVELVALSRWPDFN